MGAMKTYGTYSFDIHFMMHLLWMVDRCISVELRRYRAT